MKYPNVLVPHVEPNTQAKIASEKYQKSRAIALTRFLNYCFSSETVKQDEIFEKFLETSNAKEFQKLFQKQIEKQTEVKHLSSLFALQNEPNGSSIQSPDPQRTLKAQEMQR